MWCSGFSSLFFSLYLLYFWLAIQNTANWHVSNAFDLLSVLISFPLARCCCCGSCGFLLLLLLRAPPPHPAPLFGGRESTKKRKSPVASALAVGNVCVGVGEVGDLFAF
jgi:hypothetical protein